ncbi:hypothetical protein [Cognatilysobacter bugurensis]|uniref:DUF4124 domain-containing protein n=1 Tax=Cognatilysobacter bugurensis TaxID=543356 RepID=A0A918T1T6_9GAMM|nr:hypothetical protein [Lysobacter bugurensis]GHA82557.1 hypothetical protein GCM10007067_20670 [Lysobacter bugurensis]
MHLPRPALPLIALIAFSAALAAAQERMVIYRCAGADGAVIVQNDRPCPSGTDQQDRRVIQTPQVPANAPVAPTRPPGLIQGAPRPGIPPAPGAPGIIPPTVSPGIVPAPGAQGVVPAPGPAGVMPLGPAGAPATITVPPQTPVVPGPAALATVPGVAPTEDAAPPPLYACRVFDGTVYFGENPEPAPRCAQLATAGIGGGAAPAAGDACQVVRDECAPVPAATLCDSWRQRLRAMESALTFGRLDERETARVEIDRVRAIVDDSACGS